ncbi:unnamed protein product [Ectocarpus sp. 12 AP-2014]
MRLLLSTEGALQYAIPSGYPKINSMAIRAVSINLGLFRLRLCLRLKQTCPWRQHPNEGSIHDWISPAIPIRDDDMSSFTLSKPQPLGIKTSCNRTHLGKIIFSQPEPSQASWIATFFLCTRGATVSQCTVVRGRDGCTGMTSLSCSNINRQILQVFCHQAILSSRVLSSVNRRSTGPIPGLMDTSCCPAIKSQAGVVRHSACRLFAQPLR